MDTKDKDLYDTVSEGYDKTKESAVYLLNHTELGNQIQERAAEIRQSLSPQFPADPSSFFQNLKDIHGYPKRIGDAASNLAKRRMEEAKHLKDSVKNGILGFQNSIGEKMNAIKNMSPSEIPGLMKGGVQKIGLGYANNFKTMGVILASPVLAEAEKAKQTIELTQSVMKAASNTVQAALGNPLAAARLAKDTLKELATNPMLAVKKIFACCSCALSPVIMCIAAIIILISMFFSFLSNDSSKDDGPRAASSWIYKYAGEDYVNDLNKKINAAPEKTYFVSHNASYQQKLYDEAKDSEKDSACLDEESDAMKETAGYTNENIYVYKKPDLSSEKIPSKLRYGDNVIASIPDGENTVSEENGFIPIEVEQVEEGDKFQVDDSDTNDGMTNQNEKDAPKDIYYIEKRFVYHRPAHDSKMEYTLKDEYEIMSKALRRTLEKKQDLSIAKGNASIDNDASGFSKDVTEEDFRSSDIYKKADAAVVVNLNGDIVPELTAAKNPGADTFNQEKSRQILSSSVNSQIGLSQDVATILSGYAAAKADSLPDKGYYEMLDTTMSQYLTWSLNLEGGGRSFEEKTRVLSQRQTRKMTVCEFNETGYQGIGILLRYDPKMGGVKKYQYVFDENIRLSPKSQNPVMRSNAPSYGGIYLEKDIKKVAKKVLVQSANGKYALLTPKEYAAYANVPLADAVKKTRNYNNIIASKTERLEVLDLDPQYIRPVTFSYKEYYSAYTISALNPQRIVWAFFDARNSVFSLSPQDTYYPMIYDENGTKDARGNSINIAQTEDWMEKLKLVRSLPFYQQRLSYVFDNSSLADNADYFAEHNKLSEYPGEPPTSYYTIELGTPLSDDERMTVDELKKDMGDKFDGEILTDSDGFVTNYKKNVVWNYHSTKTKNQANIEATRKKFLWLIPLEYLQEYRKSSEPEMIQKIRLDGNYEYVKKYSSKNGFGDTGGFLPSGNVVVPVQGWQGKVTSEYGWRVDPINGSRSLHGGIDISGEEGTPLYAVFDGTVVDVGSGSSRGNYVYIQSKDSSKITAAYFHTKKVLVSQGDAVTAGQEIAKMGATGRVTGPHLHLEIYPHGNRSERMNPREFLESISQISMGHSTSISHSESQTQDPSVYENTNADEKAFGGQTGFEDSENLDNEKIVMSVGNKMDYWYDNIMQLLDKEQTVNEGNGGEAVAEYAMSFLGNVGGVYFKNSYANINSAIELTPGNTFHWCAAFVSVVMKDCGYPGYTGHGGYIAQGTANSISKEEAIAPWSFSVSIFYDWAKEHGTLHEDDGSYIPKPGDLILYHFNSQSKGNFNHIGMIYSADANGYKTIEGNTSGPGAGSGAGWKGCVNSWDRSYNDPHNYIAFISIPYPDNNSTEALLAEKGLPKVLGSSFTSVDKYGRIGVGAWHGAAAQKLLREIRSSSKDEYSALLAENANAQELSSFIDNGGEVSYGIQGLVQKMLSFKQSKQIQKQMIKERVTEIEAMAKSAYGENWNFLDGQSTLYLTTVQFVMDAYGDSHFIVNSSVKPIIEDTIQRKGDFNTLLSAIKAQTPALVNAANPPPEAQLIVGNGDMVAFLGDAQRRLSSAGGFVRSIPKDKLLGGMGNGKTWHLPPGLGSTKSLMGNHKITGTSSYQYTLKKYTTTGPHGIGMIDGRMTVAMYVGAKGSPKGYGQVGDKMDIELSTGQILHVIVADAKALENDQTAGDKTNIQYGVHHDGSIIEFILNTQTTGHYPSPLPSFTRIFPGDVKTIVNLGPSNK